MTWYISSPVQISLNIRSHAVPALTLLGLGTCIRVREMFGSGPWRRGEEKGEI